MTVNSEFMKFRRFDLEELENAIEYQLSRWPMASDNFKKLKEVKRKCINIGKIECAIQFNPTRIISTGAKTDKASIESRPCFLCKQNRPEEQISYPFSENWELLINPYPILPVHLTIPNKIHTEQGPLPLELASMAESAPGLTFFYNGAKAGASAPDHQHAQAVLTEELPLMRYAERHHIIKNGESEIITSLNLPGPLPFQFISAIILPDSAGMKIMSSLKSACGLNEDGVKDYGLLNAYFWIDKTGYMRIVIIPRKRHRPHYFFESGDERILISPGAIDMAGILITPLESDFNKIDADIIKEIYADVAFEKKLPAEVTESFGL